jgi:hypothetical protein
VSYFFEEMSAGVADQTPSMLWHADAIPNIDGGKDTMAKRETLEFVRAYYRIPDLEVRKRLGELVKSVAKVARR